MFAIFEVLHLLATFKDAKEYERATSSHYNSEENFALIEGIAVFKVLNLGAILKALHVLTIFKVLHLCAILKSLHVLAIFKVMYLLAVIEAVLFGYLFPRMRHLQDPSCPGALGM